MSTATLGASRPAAAAEGVQTKAAVRLLFVDNMRVFLTILVLLHHTMIIYAGSGSFLYTEGRQDTITSVLGNWFCSVNQAYFMSLFLLISAYFVPGSYDRKGAGHFVKDRLIRLGIPLIIYSWIISPLTWAVINYVTQGQVLPWWRYLPGAGGTLIGDGPLWFVEVLLIFSLVYAAWRRFFRPKPPVPPVETDSRFPGNAAIVLFALLTGVGAFLVRLVFPVDWNFSLLNLQLPFFVLYIALFIVGLVAYRRNWLLGLPDAKGKLWLGISIALILLFVPMALIGGAMENDQPFKGGPYWQAMAYAQWEAFMCMGMCIGLIYLFRRYLNRQGRLAKFLSPNAYIAYIIHAQVITATALLLRNVDLYPLLKFGLVALIGVSLSFVVGNLIRKLPYTDRVL
ncbi:MAG: acyltransferase [Chloroflexi bacterium]|nr:acyltransferase [Chloroflexota bacterium]